MNGNIRMVDKINIQAHKKTSFQKKKGTATRFLEGFCLSYPLWRTLFFFLTKSFQRNEPIGLFFKASLPSSYEPQTMKKKKRKKKLLFQIRAS